MKYDSTKDDQPFNSIFKNIHAVGIELEGLFMRNDIDAYWNDRELTHIKDYVNDGSINGLYLKKTFLSI